MPHPLFPPAVQTLQALRQKFDVADAPRLELHIQATPAALLGRHLFADALPRFRYRFHSAKIQRAPVNQRLHEIQQRGARRGLARRHPRFDQHLLFPIARPLRVIGSRAFFGNTNLAQRSIRPKPQIHAVALPLGGIGREQCRIVIGDLLIEFLVADPQRAIRLAAPAIHEHQVDIRTVVQLLAAQLPQRNHRKTAGRSVRQARLAVAPHQFCANSAVGDIQNRVRQVGELFGHFGKRRNPHHVAQHDAQQLPPPEARQFHRRRRAGPVFSQKLRQPQLVFFGREHPIEASRIGDPQNPLRIPQNRFRKELAVRKQIHRAA
jgi:hypothetical protein